MGGQRKPIGTRGGTTSVCTAPNIVSHHNHTRPPRHTPSTKSLLPSRRYGLLVELPGGWMPSRLCGLKPRSSLVVSSASLCSEAPLCLMLTARTTYRSLSQIQSCPLTHSSNASTL